MKAAEAHRLALSLPEVYEQDHHGFPSFRLAGKILATRPDTHHFHVMLDADDIRAAVREHPESCEEKYWGKRLSAVRVDVHAIRTVPMRSLLMDAWERAQG